MLIGELAKRSGFTRDTIRFYEKKGLISVDKRNRRDNNYKEYSEEVLNRLLSIKKLKSIGFTLNEVGELLNLVKENEASCSTVSEKMKSKIEAVDQKIRELYELRNFLSKQLNNQGASCSTDSDENCPELENEVDIEPKRANDGKL